MTSWLGVLLSGGYGSGLCGYRYSVPFVWSTLNLEQQARVVEHGWLLRARGLHKIDAGRRKGERLRRRAIYRKSLR